MSRSITLVGTLLLVVGASVFAAGPRSEPDEPLAVREGFGFAVAGPPGDGWTENPGNVIAFFREVGKGRNRLTAVAAVRTRWMSGCEQHSDCLARALDQIRQPVSGIATTRLDIADAASPETTCRTMKKVEIDRRTSRRLFEVRVSGLICTHPDAPTLVLEVGVSERYRKGAEASSELADQAASFVAGFSFRPLEVAVSEVVEIGEESGYIEPGDSVLWVHGWRHLHEVDVDGFTARDKFFSPSNRYPFVLDSRSVWLSAAEKPELLRLWRVDGSVRSKTALPHLSYAAKLGFGSIWLTPAEGSAVSRVDATTGELLAAIDVGEGPMEIAVDDTSVWVAEHESADLIHQIDPAANAVVSSFRPCSVPAGITSGKHGVWVACHEAGRLVRFDRTSHEVTGSVAIGSAPLLLATDGATVWITHGPPDGGIVTAVDAATLEIVARVPLGREMLYPRVVGDLTWIPDSAGPRIYAVRRIASEPDEPR